MDPKENDKLTIQNAIAQAPNPRVAAAIRDAAQNNLAARLSPSEREALAAFKQGARAAESVRQQNEKHGGPVRMAQKERAFAGVRSMNEHEGKK